MTADDQLLVLFEEIVSERLSIPTLQRRGRDFLDFHDISVWGLLTVLQDAYDAGVKAGRRAP
jgi:hypothetical protein